MEVELINRKLCKMKELLKEEITKYVSFYLATWWETRN